MRSFTVFYTDKNRHAPFFTLQIEGVAPHRRFKKLPKKERDACYAIVKQVLAAYEAHKNERSLQHLTKVKIEGEFGREWKIHLFEGDQEVALPLTEKESSSPITISECSPWKVPGALGGGIYQLAVHLYQWVVHLFTPHFLSQKSEAEEQKLFFYLLNQPFQSGVDSLSLSQQASEFLRLFKKNGSRSFKEAPIIIKELEFFLKGQSHFEKSLEEMRELLGDGRTKTEGCALQKSLQEYIVSQWMKKVETLPEGNMCLLPIVHNQMVSSSSFLRIEKSANNQFLVEVLSANEAKRYEHLSFAQIQDLYKTALLYSPKPPLFTQPLGDKHIPLPAERVRKGKGPSTVKAFHAYLSSHDAGSYLSRWKIEMRLEALARFYAKSRLHWNDTNLYLMEEGVRKISHALSKGIELGTLSADEVHYLQTSLDSLSKEVQQVRAQRHPHPLSFPSHEASPHHPSVTWAKRGVHPIHSFSSTNFAHTREVTPRPLLTDKEACLEHAKKLSQEGLYEELGFFVGDALLLLPDQVKQTEIASWIAYTEQMTVYLIQSSTGQQLDYPHPPEWHLAMERVYIFYDALAGLEDPDYKLQEGSPFFNELGNPGRHERDLEGELFATPELRRQFSPVKDRWALSGYPRLITASEFFIPSGYGLYNNTSEKKPEILACKEYLSKRVQRLKASGSIPEDDRLRDVPDSDESLTKEEWTVFLDRNFSLLPKGITAMRRHQLLWKEWKEASFDQFYHLEGGKRLLKEGSIPEWSYQLERLEHPSRLPSFARYKVTIQRTGWWEDNVSPYRTEKSWMTSWHPNKEHRYNGNNEPTPTHQSLSTGSTQKMSEEIRERCFPESPGAIRVMDLLGLYEQDWPLLQQHQHQDDLYRALFFAQKNDHLQEMLAHPAFRTQVAPFIERMATLFMGQGDMGTAGFCWYLGALLHAHDPSLGFEGSTEKIRACVQKATDVEQKKVLYTFLGCLTIEKETLDEKEKEELAIAHLMQLSVELDDELHHPLRDHQLNRAFYRHQEVLFQSLKEETFRETVLNGLIRGALGQSLDNKEKWTGAYPVYRKGVWTIDVDEKMVYRQDKPITFIPSRVKKDSHFRYHFGDEFKQIVNISYATLQGGKQQVPCFSFERNGVPMRVLEVEKRVFIQRQIDNEWYEWQINANQNVNKFESGWRKGNWIKIFERKLVTFFSRMNVIRLSGFLKQRLLAYAPYPLMSGDLWIKVGDPKQALIAKPHSQVAFSCLREEQVVDNSDYPADAWDWQGVVRNRVDVLASCSDCRKGSPAQGMKLLNVWEKEEGTFKPFQQFASPNQTLVWGTSNIPEVVEFYEHGLFFTYDKANKRWMAAAPQELKGYYLVPRTRVHELNRLTNSLVLQNEAGEERVLVARRDLLKRKNDPFPDFPTTTSEYFHFIPGLLVSALRERESDPLTADLLFHHRLPASLIILKKDPIHRVLKPVKEDVGSSFYLMSLYLKTRQWERALELLRVIPKRGELSEEAKKELEELKKVARFDPRGEIVLLHLALQWEATRLTIPDLYATYKRFLSKGNLARFPAALLLTQQQQKKCDPSTQEKTVTLTSPPSAKDLVQVMQRALLRSSSEENDQTRSIKLLMKKIREIPQAKKRGQLLEEIRELKQDAYVNVLRDFAELALEMDPAALPTFLSDFIKSPVDERTLSACYDYLEQRRKDPLFHRSILPVLSEHHRSQKMIDASSPSPFISVEEMTADYCKQTPRDTPEEKRAVKGEVSTLLSTLAVPNHEKMGAKVQEYLLEDYATFEKEEQFSYQWQGSPIEIKKALQKRIEKIIDPLERREQRLQEDMDRLLQKKTQEEDAPAVYGLKKLAMGVPTVTASRLRFLFLQGELQKLQSINPALTADDIQRLCRLMTEKMILETEIQQGKRGLVLLEKMGNEAQDSYLEEFFTVITAARHYNPWENPEFLVMEVEANILLRRKQLSIINTMIKEPNIARQLIMGAGKTDAILPLVAAAKADGKHLSFAVTTASLYPSLKEKLSERLNDTLHRGVSSFAWNRQSLDKTCEEAKGLYKQFLGSIGGKEVVLTTRESLECLEGSYRELARAYKKTRSGSYLEALKELYQVRKLVREVGLFTVDEMEKVMDPMEKTIFSIGKGGHFEEEELDLTIALYLQLDRDPALHLEANGQTSLTPAQREEVLNRLAEWAIDECFKKVPDQADALLYIQGKSTSPQFEEWLDKSPDRHKLSLARGLIGKILPLTLDEKGQVTYIRSEENGIDVVPCEDKDVPKEGSQFGHRLENLCYTLQDYLQKGVEERHVEQRVSQWHQEALKEMEQRHCSYEETAGAKTFFSIFQFSMEGLKRTRLGKLQKEEITHLTTLLGDKKNRALLAQFTRRAHLEEMALYDQFVEMDAEQFGSMSAGLSGFSGTMNPRILHRRIDNPEEARSLGTDSKTLYRLLRNNQEGSIIQKLPPTAGTSYATTEEVKALFNVLQQYEMIVDTGGTIQIPENEVPPLLASDRPVVYFEEGSLKRLEATDQSTKKPPVVFLPMKLRRGADTKISKQAAGVHILDTGVTLEEAFQSAGRERGMHEGQKVYFAVPPWLIPHLPKGEVNLQNVLKNLLAEKVRQEAERNYRHALAEIKDVVRTALRDEGLHVGLERELELMEQYPEFFSTTVGYRPYEEFKDLNKQIEPEEQLREEIEALIKRCGEEPALQPAVVALQNLLQSLPAASYFYPDKVLKATSTQDRTEIHVETEVEVHQKQKIEGGKEPLVHFAASVLRIPEGLTQDAWEKLLLEPIQSPKASVKELFEGDRLSKNYFSYTHENRHIAMQGRWFLRDYNYHSGTTSYSELEFPPESSVHVNIYYLHPAQERLHPALSPRLTLTDNWFPQTALEFGKLCAPENQVVVRELAPFGFEEQQPVHWVKLIAHPDGRKETRILGREDLQQEENLFANDTSSTIPTALYDLRTGKTLRSINSPPIDAFKMELVQAKILGGLLYTTKEENLLIDEWLTPLAKSQIKELFALIDHKVLHFYPKRRSTAPDTYFYGKCQELLTDTSSSDI